MRVWLSPQEVVEIPDLVWHAYPTKWSLAKATSFFQWRLLQNSGLPDPYAVYLTIESAKDRLAKFVYLDSRRGGPRK